jgi:hypothetical protein
MIREPVKSLLEGNPLRLLWIMARGLAASSALSRCFNPIIKDPFPDVIDPHEKLLIPTGVGVAAGEDLAPHSPVVYWQCDGLSHLMAVVLDR